jgi:Chromo (CHRromatin Organisation MOdifier) domain
VTYQLKLPESWRIHKVFHAALLRPYGENEVYGENYIRPLPDIEEGEEVYEVEQILKHRKRGQDYEYLIKWVSYLITEALWEPKSNLTGLVQLIFFGNTKNSISCKPHAILWEIEVYSKSLPTKPCTLEQSRGVFENRTPHGRHAPGICIYVSTILTFLTPHSSFTSPSTS